MALPGDLSDDEMAEPIMTQKIISEQLPIPTPIKTQYQLPKATLSKTQRLELLEERFLRGEVDLETYKELKTKIEAKTGQDITIDNLEEQTAIVSHQAELTQGPSTEEGVSNSTVKSDQEALIPQDLTEITLSHPQQSIQEGSPIPDLAYKTPQQQDIQQSSIQFLQPKRSVKEQNDEK
jgi:hypothetical protein